MEIEANSLGSRLKKIRSERGLSQRELAERAGISANAISLIERNENSPSVATLQSLTSALGIKISYFFEEERPGEVLLVRSGQRPELWNDGVRIEGVGGKLQNQELEPFLVHLEPGSGSGRQLVIHSGHELVYCLAGKIEYRIDSQVYRLNAGDLLLFQAHLPHCWLNPGSQPASFFLVLQTPGETEESIQRHFSEYPSLPHIQKP
jgi:transcriptional regulator with XRE-family HTH domain